MSAEEFLVILNVPPSLEDAMVDCLLTFEYDQGFSSFPINTHDHKNEGLSLAEQVTGQQRKIRFQMLVLQDDLPALIKKIKARFSSAGIHYWVVPVVENGFI